MDTEQIKSLLERYNQGLCTPEEAELVDQWFDQINPHTPGMNKEDLHLQLSDIKSRIDFQLAPGKPVRRMRRWYIPAAAAAVLIIAGIFWFYPRKPSNIVADNHTQTATPALATRTIKDGSVIISTPRMVKDTIQLEDGSSIVLNAGSRLRYPEHFSNTNRSIWLEEGEAFFDATTDAARPFIVHTGPFTTTVLGTTFNIRTYAAEKLVTVALFTGKVKVDHPIADAGKTASLVLHPSEQVSFSLMESNIKKTYNAKSEEYSGWKQGLLVFKDASFTELATRIQNHFGVTVINQSSKTTWNYNGVFRSESLKDVMETLCIATGLSYSIKNNTVYLLNKN